jgi:hypothetical protein
MQNTWVHNFNYIVVYKALLKNNTIFSRCTNVKNIVRSVRKEGVDGEIELEREYHSNKKMLRKQ